MIRCAPGKRARSRGFTLLEMVAVIVLLGVLAAGIGSFIKVGSQIYLDTSNREQLVASARFAVERLNREIRTALPNSVRVTLSGGRQCLEYTPSVTSAVYLDIPVAPETASDQVSIARLFDESLFNDSLRVAVYPLNPDDVYTNNNKLYDIKSGSSLNTVGDQSSITLSSAVTFAADSPTRRIFLIGGAVAYCVENAALWRHTGYGYTNLQPDNAGVLMAKYVASSAPFHVNEASHLRNATVTATLTFARDGDSMTFNTEVQIPNVP